MNPGTSAFGFPEGSDGLIVGEEVLEFSWGVGVVTGPFREAAGGEIEEMDVAGIGGDDKEFGEVGAERKDFGGCWEARRRGKLCRMRGLKGEGVDVAAESCESDMGIGKGGEVDAVFRTLSSIKREGKETGGRGGEQEGLRLRSDDEKLFAIGGEGEMASPGSGNIKLF